jgi:AraC family transcriptional regulator
MNDTTRKKHLREEYISRINRVIDYIESNIDKELKLESLAQVANFSPFHFHRIFRALIGEPLNQFIQRLRIERAAQQLIANPKKPITRIAYDCGFGSSASFARAFKDHYSVSPSMWRMTANDHKSKNGIFESKNGKRKSNIGKDQSVSHTYIESKSQNQLRRNAMARKQSSKNDFKVAVRDLPDMHVAYIRHIGPYQGDVTLFERLFTKLFKWAGARDLLNFPETKVLSVYHDNPEITDEGKLRTSVCITVPEKTPVDGEIGTMTVPGGKYAVAHFELSEDEFQEAWNGLYGEWLPGSGYQPDDRPSFEICLNDPKEHPQQKHIVDICIPVKPL